MELFLCNEVFVNLNLHSKNDYLHIQIVIFMSTYLIKLLDYISGVMSFCCKIKIWQL